MLHIQASASVRQFWLFVAFGRVGERGSFAHNTHNNNRIHVPGPDDTQCYISVLPSALHQRLQGMFKSSTWQPCGFKGSESALGTLQSSSRVLSQKNLARDVSVVCLLVHETDTCCVPNDAPTLDPLPEAQQTGNIPQRNAGKLSSPLTGCLKAALHLLGPHEKGAKSNILQPA